MLKKLSDKNKGKHFSLKTEFKKGDKAWNKGLEFLKIRGENHHNWSGGIGIYKKILQRNNIKPTCAICGKSGEFGRKIQIHHKDNNRSNNNLKNLMVVCSKCHSHIHKNWEKRWQNV